MNDWIGNGMPHISKAGATLYSSFSILIVVWNLIQNITMNLIPSWKCWYFTNSVRANKTPENMNRNLSDFTNQNTKHSQYNKALQNPPTSKKHKKQTNCIFHNQWAWKAKKIKWIITIISSINPIISFHGWVFILYYVIIWYDAIWTTWWIQMWIQ